MKGLAVFLCLTVGAASAENAGAAGLVTRWEAALEGCLDVVETGDLAHLRAAGWELAAQGLETHFRHPSGVMITLLQPLRRPDTVSQVCWLSYGSKIPGNDRRGQVLRGALRDLAEGRLVFREEDQILPPDIYRGCAWDGREFRLSSMTQTGFASFGFYLSPGDPDCAPLTS